MRGLLIVVALVGLVPASAAAAGEAGGPPWVVTVDGVPIDVIAAEIDPVEVIYGLGKDQLGSDHLLLGDNVPFVRLLFGRARFRLAGDLDQEPVLAQWLSDVAAGQDVRKDITIQLFLAGGVPGRRYELPQALLTGVSDTEFEVELSGLTVLGEPIPGVGSVENPSPTTFGSDAEPDDQLRERAPEALAEEDRDDATVVQCAAYKRARGSGPAVALVGEAAVVRPALQAWVNAILERTFVLLDEITIGRSNPTLQDLPHVYRDCLITRIQIPRLSAGSAEPIEEVVVIKAERPGDPA